VTPRRARLLGLLDSAGLRAVVLRRPGNVAWYSGGGRSHIVSTLDSGVAAVVVTADGDSVVTAANEAGRLRAEELGGLDAAWTVVGPTDPLPLPTGPEVGVDGPLPGCVDVTERVAALRVPLLPDEVERYRAVGRAAAEAMTEAARSLAPADTEHDAAAAVAHALRRRGLDPVVLLVAGESRVYAHRHPLPTGAPLGRLAMLVTCARGHGLIANLTRYAGTFTAAEEETYRRLLAVEAAFLDATVPGAVVGDVVRAGRAAYAANGFDPAEPDRHHQGGPTGYEPRDYLATPSSPARVVAGQAFAWNPSVPGLKVEDTVLVTERGIELLTVDERWPVLAAGGRARPRPGG
jgi:Xaa-Pro aminopeptidase